MITETSNATEPTTTAKQPPEAVRAVITIWARIKAAFEVFEASLVSIRADEVALRRLGREDYMASTPKACRITEKHRKEIVESLRWQLYAAARERFAPAGASLNVSVDSDDCQAAGTDTFDPQALWEHIESVYGGDSGKNMAYRSAALKFVDAAPMEAGESMRTIGGKPTFSVTTHWEDGVCSQRLGRYSAETIQKVLDGFKAAATWADLWSFDLQCAHNSLLSALDDAMGRGMGARGGLMPGRTSYGELALIVPFKSKWEFRLTPEFAEKLQLFVAEFGSAAHVV